MMANCPWQLYVFSLFNIVGGVVSCCNFVCDWVFGNCSADVENVVLRCFALSMLYVGVLFFVLTFINHGNAEKSKRLAMVATQCTVAMFVGVIMAGPEHLGGVEKGWAHLTDMITIAVLLVIMWTAIADDKDVAGCSNLYSGLGINPKTLLWLFLIGSIVKVFLVSDVMSYHQLLNDADASSDVARVLWNYMDIFVLEVALVLFFAIGYGDDKDQESTVVTIVVMTIVAVCGMIGMYYKEGLLRQMIISVVVIFLLAVGAIAGGRREQRSSAGYTEVGNV